MNRSEGGRGNTPDLLKDLPWQHWAAFDDGTGNNGKGKGKGQGQRNAVARGSGGWNSSSSEWWDSENKWHERGSTDDQWQQ